jgi:hypothetical protein
MGKKLAEVRNWNPLSEDIIRNAFSENPTAPLLNVIENSQRNNTEPETRQRPIIREAATFKQFRMAEADGLVVEHLLTALRTDLGVKVTFTDLVHAMVFMVDKKREDVSKEAKKTFRKLPRPQLSDGPAMREFQKSLANVLLDGVSGHNRFD